MQAETVKKVDFVSAGGTQLHSHIHLKILNYFSS